SARFSSSILLRAERCLISILPIIVSSSRPRKKSSPPARQQRHPPVPLRPREVHRARVPRPAALDRYRLLIHTDVGMDRSGPRGRDRDHDVMTVALVVIIYIVFCILTGLCGSQRRMGFFGTFIMSLFITPIVMLIVLKLTAPSERVEWRHRPQSD